MVLVHLHEQPGFSRLQRGHQEQCGALKVSLHPHTAAVGALIPRRLRTPLLSMLQVGKRSMARI